MFAMITSGLVLALVFPIVYCQQKGMHHHQAGHHRSLNHDRLLGDCHWDMAIEYSPHVESYDMIPSIEPGNCCTHCKGRCTHWVWRGGMCLLKEGPIDHSTSSPCAEANAESVAVPSYHCASGLAKVAQSHRFNATSVPAQHMRQSSKRPDRIFCFVVIRPTERERQSLDWQLPLLKECDYYAVFSNSSSAIPMSVPASSVQILNGSMDSPGEPMYGNALNTPVFLPVFHRAFAVYSPLADWTIKFDVDVVFDLGRLRQILLDYDPSAPVVLCNKQLCRFAPDPTHPTCLDGPIEILSRPAAAAYVKNRAECETQVDYRVKGEDWYLDVCVGEVLRLLKPVETRLLVNSYFPDSTREKKRDWMVRLVTWCTTAHGRGSKAAFHPVKNAADFRICIQNIKRRRENTSGYGD